MERLKGLVLPRRFQACGSGGGVPAAGGGRNHQTVLSIKQTVVSLLGAAACVMQDDATKHEISSPLSSTTGVGSGRGIPSEVPYYGRSPPVYPSRKYFFFWLFFSSRSLLSHSLTLICYLCNKHHKPIVSHMTYTNTILKQPEMDPPPCNGPRPTATPASSSTK